MEGIFVLKIAENPGKDCSKRRINICSWNKNQDSRPLSHSIHVQHVLAFQKLKSSYRSINNVRVEFTETKVNTKEKVIQRQDKSIRVFTLKTT